MRIQANIPADGFAEIEIREGAIGTIRVIGPTDPEKTCLSPGFVDIQVNGFAGVDFSDPFLTPEKAASVLPAIRKTGVTTFCPTLITNTHEALLQNFRVLEEARRSNPQFAESVPCYHLEGPFLSPGDARGAHDPTLMRAASWDEFSELQVAAGGRIGILTLAPEVPGALDLIQRARQAGVVVAIGHTDASQEQIHLAVEAGAELSTHLGNGCPRYIHRHESPLWAELAIDRLSASIICDGFHVPPDLVRVIYLAKGIKRCILITDAIHVATLQPGRYSLVGREIELLPNGKVATQDGWSLAGSALSMNRAVSVFQRFAEIPLEDAIRAATTSPAALLRRRELCSEIAEGQPASLVLYRPESEKLRIEAVVLKGRPVYVEEGSSAAEQLG